MKRPPMHPTELTCPCCLPALGEFSEMLPHGGLAGSLGQGGPAGQSEHRFPASPTQRVASSAEVSPSGLWRSLGKRVGLTPSGVRIPLPPQIGRPGENRGVRHFATPSFRGHFAGEIGRASCRERVFPYV